MKTLEEMRLRRRVLKMTYAELSEKSGVPVTTIQKVFSGTTYAPRKGTMESLEKALFGPHSGISEEKYPANQATESGPISLNTYLEEKNPSVVKEPVSFYGAGSTGKNKNTPGVLWKPQGTYTTDDYERLPEGERYELIDGVLIRLESPSIEHQQLVIFVAAQLNRFAEEEECDCLVLCAPCDVQLDADDKTIVQPDVFVYCDDAKVTPKRGVGAPDLCIEILSPTTRSKDQLLKRYKYERAGVREFWVVDPEFSHVMVYEFDKSGMIEKQYTLDEKVPVGICGGKHSIDFSRRIPGFFRKHRP